MYRLFGNLEFRLQLTPFLLPIFLVFGLILSVLGTPMTIFGSIIDDKVILNIGIVFLVIGSNLLVYGLIFRSHMKMKG